MAYEKQTWVNGDVITAEKMNHMEDGIANAGGGDAGYECSGEVLFDESIAIVSGEGKRLVYSELITEPIITVEFDGVEYTCQKVEMRSASAYGGLGQTGPDFTNYPFLLVSGVLPTGEVGNEVYTSASGNHQIKVSTDSVTVTPCFEKAVKSVTGGGSQTALNNIRDAGNGGIVEGFVDGNVATGKNAHAEGGMLNLTEGGAMNTTASGEASHAEGKGTKATDRASHAEGVQTTASGFQSHAEGILTTASGPQSHAEGYNTKASGDSSHAEGNNTTANKSASHAEGDSTTASGFQSHAEGDSTIARGENSHAEGRGTIARGNNQHVQGKYNVEDTEGKYAFIVGNGTGEDSRSNAFAMKWDGTFVFADGTEITPAQFRALLG